MAGLLVIGVGIAWLVISLFIALRLARWPKVVWGKIAVFLIAWTVLLVGPLVDEIVGTRQFESYCKAAENVRFSGTITTGADLYTPEGHWRLADPFPLANYDELTKLVRLADSRVRWDHGTSIPVPAMAPMWQRHTHIYDAHTNRPVADWVSYSYRGGWLSRIVLGERLDECRPKLMRESGYQMYNKIFQYQK
jgi:hypothetical protein